MNPRPRPWYPAPSRLPATTNPDMPVITTQTPEDPAAYTTAMLNQMAQPMTTRHWLMTQSLSSLATVAQYLTPVLKLPFVTWRCAALFIVLCYFLWTTSTPAWVAKLRRQVVDNARIWILI